ncbi:uncharacterized protein F5Z01DRAFT_648147 [Emericellopsis atlantica]|uniref:Filamentation protein n=1 Tax=Emericellopsis atlantica TaxID=2614577 RepID=A0A9P8CSH9_9HYPO|nr:uncharacterized protein F5Z01DRAFT_648147 [Emericellopsis atlantica]KAG9257220.1 hypothetical protein F5Z01DRAFT_648147 [Emericellopsis atlantica]
MSSKAANYLHQLDRARCDGNWSAVPELVRKVRKHAPERACLALTAETECAIANATLPSSQPNRPSTDEPASNQATSRHADFSTRLPALLESIEKETHYVEDRFQARVCVGWLHWTVAEYTQAAGQLPKGLNQEDSQLDGAESLSEWTAVCALKSAFLRADCLNRDYSRHEALDAFKSGLPALAKAWSGQGAGKQLKEWSEMYLTEYCMLSSEALHEGDVSLEDHNALACYRSWARYWEVHSSAGGYASKGSTPRRRVWKEYYIALSRIVEQDLPFPTGYLSKITNEMSARTQLRDELKTTEAAYQNLLFSETSFPRADEERAEVEELVTLAVKNWSILCGRGWRESDLGPGGRNSASHRVLDLLYKAATKTFHSTSVLRSLFLVHMAVGEFDLAFKAFDSYIDIVKKVKARVDKTGQYEPSLDTDGVVLQTMAQAVITLCQYGGAQSAEKARHLASELEDLLATLPQLKTAENGDGTAPGAQHGDKAGLLHPPVAPHIVALSWQAIGLSHANWSRITREAASRTEIQGRAIRCLRRSLAAEYGRSKDIRSYFSLGLLLAERREITAAIEVVKTALVSSKGKEGQYHLHFGQYWQERSLVPMWHLLSLLLSARQDFAMASRACEGALEQFKDPTVLFGKETSNFRSEHLNDVEEKVPAHDPPKGLVDEMDDMEKEAILEVKMTQLSLVELLEGPDVAVNASSELLVLFARLFGNFATPAQTLKPPKPAEPPKTSGTLRSIRGSIFGGRDRSRPPTRQTSAATTLATPTAPPTVSEEPSESTASDARPPTAKTVNSAMPSIQVTGDGEGKPARSESTNRARRSDSRRRNSLRKKDRSASRRRTSNATAPSQPELVDGEPFFTPAAAAERDQSDFFTYAGKRQPSSMSSFSRGPTLPTLNSYLSTVSKTSDRGELIADDTHPPTDILPLVQLSKDKARFRRTSILVRVWLMIAGFYRRADLYDQCKAAVAEAQKLVQGLEADARQEPSTSPPIRGEGWAERKSVVDLRGDVYSELGYLALAEGNPYQARSEFESALMHAPDHPSATVGLSDILLDLYAEVLRPTPPTPAPAAGSTAMCSHKAAEDTPKTLPTHPLGLRSTPVPHTQPQRTSQTSISDDLPAPYKATCLPLSDRLAARDRAYTLLSGLTRLGTGWNYSDAWFSLARAYEESGQEEKAKEVLWWCVELEEGRGVREWDCLGGGGYIL